MGLFSDSNKRMAKVYGTTAEGLPRALAKSEQERQARHALFVKQQEAIRQAAAERKARKGR